MSIVFAHSYCELIYLIFVSFCFHRHLECESATEWIWLEGVSATEWIRIMIEASSAIIGLKSIHFCSSTWQKGLLGYICILKVNTLLFNIFTPRHESSQSSKYSPADEYTPLPLHILKLGFRSYVIQLAVHIWNNDIVNKVWIYQSRSWTVCSRSWTSYYVPKSTNRAESLYIDSLKSLNSLMYYLSVHVESQSISIQLALMN